MMERDSEGALRRIWQQLSPEEQHILCFGEADEIEARLSHKLLELQPRVDGKNSGMDKPTLVSGAMAARLLDRLPRRLAERLNSGGVRPQRAAGRRARYDEGPTELISRLQAIGCPVPHGEMSARVEKAWRFQGGEWIQPSDGGSSPLHVHSCQWGDTEVPVVYAGTGDEQQPVYFFRGYTFHPGTKPVTPPLTGSWRGKLAGSHIAGRRVFVLDTGWTDLGATSTRLPWLSSTASDNVDPLVGNLPPGFGPAHDLVRGHGPAIVDQILQRTQSNADVHLVRIRYEASTHGSPHLVPVTTPNDWAKPYEFVRGFGEDALVATLKHLDNAYGPEPNDVINLSLGTVLCAPDVNTDDPVRKQIEQFIDRGVHVVAAAGNHANTVPGWPAAYATDWPNTPGLGRRNGAALHSVGSGASNSNPDWFSARHKAGEPWITDWRDGSDIPVAQTPPSAKGDPVAKSWSGTSFAAPEKSAELVMGAQRADGGGRHG